MLIIRAGIYNMLVTIANREDPDQIAVCLSLFDRQLVLTISKHYHTTMDSHAALKTVSILINRVD